LKLTFKKKAGKTDELLIERNDGSKEVIPCPKQGIIPHDMVHYAVEKVVSRRGFLSRLAAGEVAEFRMSREAEADAIERLVESIQAEMWSGRVPAEEVVALYQHACAARSHPHFPVSAGDIQLIRSEIDQLTAEWEAVAVHSSLVLTLDAAA
jgi:hypothetical protein